MECPAKGLGYIPRLCATCQGMRGKCSISAGRALLGIAPELLSHQPISHAFPWPGNWGLHVVSTTAFELKEVENACYTLICDIRA